MRLDPDIAALNLDPISYKLHVDEDWSLKEIDAAILNYRVFLQAIRNHSGNLVPTKQIDTVWHHHILDTEKYIADCDKIFGRYVHHFPYSGLLGKEDADRQRQRFKKSEKIYKNITQEYERTQQ